MTITVDANTYNKYVNKIDTLQAALVAGKHLKFYVARVTCGASDNYATGGIVADLNIGGRIIDEIIAAIPVTSSINYISKYDITNKKVLLYTSNGAAPAAFLELGNASTVTQSATFDFLVIGV